MLSQRQAEPTQTSLNQQDLSTHLRGHQIEFLMYLGRHFQGNHVTTTTKRKITRSIKQVFFSNENKKSLRMQAFLKIYQYLSEMSVIVFTQLRFKTKRRNAVERE